MIIKKSFLIIAAVIVAAGATLGTVCAAAANKKTSATDMPTVVIDAGHGGIDNGVIGVSSGTHEADINLAISRYLREDFALAGFNTVMTRYTEAGLYGTTTKGFKARDMQKRRQIIEDSGADIVISVHQNYCPLPSKKGAIVFYDKDSDGGKLLAQSIQSELDELTENGKSTGALTGDYYMLKCTSNPSVIVECGFLSNTEEDELLNTKDYQKQVAYAIFKGAVGYLAGE